MAFRSGKRELKVPVEPAQDQPFAFMVETQRGTATLPVELALEPMRVKGRRVKSGFSRWPSATRRRRKRWKSKGLSG